MQTANRTVDSTVRWHILRRNGRGAAAALVTFWGLTLLTFILSLFGLALVRRGSVLTPELFAVISAVVTPLACLHVVRWFLKASKLARRGVRVMGTIRRVGGAMDLPSCRLEITYMINGRACRRKVGGGSGNYEVGSRVELIVDPDKPRRCMFLEDVFPAGYHAGIPSSE